MCLDRLPLQLITPSASAALWSSPVRVSRIVDRLQTPPRRRVDGRRETKAWLCLHESSCRESGCVGSADVRHRDFHEHVGRFLNCGDWHLRHTHIPRAVIYERFHNGSLPVCRVSDFMLHRRGEESLKAIPPPPLKAGCNRCATELCRPSHSCASREAARDQWTDCHSPRRHNRDSSSQYPRRTPGIPCGVQ